MHLSYKEGTNTEMIRFIIYLGAKISCLYQTEYSIVEKAITSIRTIVFHLFDILADPAISKLYPFEKNNLLILTLLFDFS